MRKQGTAIRINREQITHVTERDDPNFLYRDLEDRLQRLGEQFGLSDCKIGQPISIEKVKGSNNAYSLGFETKEQFDEFMNQPASLTPVSPEPKQVGKLESVTVMNTHPDHNGLSSGCRTINLTIDLAFGINPHDVVQSLRNIGIEVPQSR